MRILWLSLMAAVLGAATAAMVARDGAGPESWTEGPDQATTRPHPLTDAQEKDALAYIKEHRPDEYDRLLKIKDDRPHLYRMALASTWHMMQMPAEIQKLAEQEQQARLKAWRLSREFLKADEAQKATLRKELTDTLGTAFDAEQQMRERRLAQLEDEIGHLRAQVKDRVEQRGRIIEENLKNLLEQTGRGPMGLGLRPHAPSKPTE